MQYRPLGKSGIDVSVICLGTMTWGRQNSEQDAHQQLDYAVAQGVNFIDTAEIYPPPVNQESLKLFGTTERHLGTWLAKNASKRDKVIIASKIVGGSELNWIRPDLSENGMSVTNKANILAALETSLQRLQTDYIDLYQIHWPSRATNFFGSLNYKHDADNQALDKFAEIVETMNALITQGKIRAWGVSNETPYGLMEYQRHADRLGATGLVSIQNPYSLLNRSFEVGLAEIAIRNEMPLLAYSPLGFGVLSGKYLDGKMPATSRLAVQPDYWLRFSNELSVAATRDYVALAQKYQLDAAQMALAFVNQQPFVASNIIGATTMEQLQSNITSADITLSAELLAEIEILYQQYGTPSP